MLNAPIESVCYSINGIRATDYNMLVTAGVLVKVVAVTVITRDHLEVNLVVALVRVTTTNKEFSRITN